MKFKKIIFVSTYDVEWSIKKKYIYILFNTCIYYIFVVLKIIYYHSQCLYTFNPLSTFNFSYDPQ